MASFMEWVDATKRISQEPEGCVCPNCGNVGLAMQLVGDSARMIGHAYVWCARCLQGIHVSRVSIPEGVPFLPMNVTEEELLKSVPRYEVIE